MAMGNGEQSRDKMGGFGVEKDFRENCRYTEKREPQHKSKMDHRGEGKARK